MNQIYQLTNKLNPVLNWWWQALNQGLADNAIGV